MRQLEIWIKRVAYIRKFARFVIRRPITHAYNKSADEKKQKINEKENEVTGTDDDFRHAQKQTEEGRESVQERCLHQGGHDDS